jgi:hypothetical protein
MTDLTPSGQLGGSQQVVRTGESDAVEQTRARAGMFAVFASDIAIAVAAIWGVVEVNGSKNANATSVVSILSSAFTAVATLTTAYFGIKATANTAKAAVTR